MMLAAMVAVVIAFCFMREVVVVLVPVTAPVCNIRVTDIRRNCYKKVTTGKKSLALKRKHHRKVGAPASEGRVVQAAEVIFGNQAGVKGCCPLFGSFSGQGWN